ncbi:phosphatidylserine decarboxylase, partial [Nematocida homosporus]|uniref:phosphatidylserine decarboxylase n=1 Tax=Nematocida homosporus TaxID=1912981 RepID=UPI00221EEFCA
MDSTYKLPIPSSLSSGSNTPFTIKKRRYVRAKKSFSLLSTLFLAIVIINIIEDRYIAHNKLEIEYSIIRSFPLKTYSRLQGFICRIKYPWPLNLAIVGLFKNLVGISLVDAERSSLREYSSINDLFTRKLAQSARPLGRGVISPVDGTVMYAGEVGGSKQKIKGVVYREEDLVNLTAFPSRQKVDNKMYQIVIYLSPANYHRFHTFLDFQLEEIKHVPSQLFSVGKGPMRYLKGLLSKNERVVFSGRTCWGYGALVAVGSTGVGSITTPFAPIKTNRFFQQQSDIKNYPVSFMLGKGDELGNFNLGSTVVLFFEAPSEFELTCSEGVVRLGESLGE